MSLKSKTINGFKWSFLDTFIKYFLTFFISVVLARILSPSDYGLIGLVSVFISFSRVFIDGGFSDSLIRKIDCSVQDYSTVLIFNLFLSLFLYLILFFSAPAISVFFSDLRLTDLIRVAGIGLIIGATSSVHSVILKKELNFRTLTIIGFFSTVISGFISLSMAFNGYGVWSLVINGLIQGVFTSALLWFYSKTSIQFAFKLNLLKEHFRFGSKIMFGSFFHMTYNNMFFVLIGKIYNPAILGYYTRADNFQKLFSDNIDIIVRQVTYPVLAQLQSSEDKLRETYRTLIKFTSFLIFSLLLGLFVISKHFIVVLIGEKWLPSVPFLQILCFAGIFMPLISINMNVLNVKGRSDLSLKVVVLKIILAFPALLIGYYFGIYAMIFGLLIAVIVTYIIVAGFSGLMIKYGVKEQLRDFLPIALLITISYIPAYMFGIFFQMNYLLILGIQILLMIFFLILLAEIFNNQEYNMIKNLLLKRK